jgi:hypothetical protein
VEQFAKAEEPRQEEANDIRESKRRRAGEDKDRGTSRPHCRINQKMGNKNHAAMKQMHDSGRSTRSPAVLKKGRGVGCFSEDGICGRGKTGSGFGRFYRDGAERGETGWKVEEVCFQVYAARRHSKYVSR